ncbi:replication factor C subunit 4-like isoform X1 [Leptotrombidium deliense]|uniref:Replication factor C subunit 4-like isoform X1 n=1 Tax=Leptotrombidium deliense TaxID=299467 RepID=A0A443SHX9_9ACAR|nr:replication factor C subunit 4-like isoform X1 [Leptotrombidium deliense]
MSQFFEAFIKNPQKKDVNEEAMEVIEIKSVTPWVEKYRPKKIDEVVYQHEVVSVLRKCLEGHDFPNLLFYGPPGTGKTSTILALAREMFGSLFSERVLELNASDERGIQVVREKIKKFAQQAVGGKRKDGTTCPPFKLVVLDEADSMTKDAQSALRRTMEKDSSTTRFCIICNYISRIIEPIASRCTKFRFKALKTELLVTKLQSICEAENVMTDDLTLEEIVNISEGDMRKAITSLQTAFRYNGSDHQLTVEDIYEISGLIPFPLIENVISACKELSYDKLESSIMELVHQGFAANRFLNQLHDWTISDKSRLQDKQKSAVCEAIAVSEHQLLNGASETLQMLNVGSILLKQFQ